MKMPPRARVVMMTPSTKGASFTTPSAMIEISLRCKTRKMITNKGSRNVDISFLVKGKQ